MLSVGFWGHSKPPLEKTEKAGNTFSGWSEIPERMPKHDVTVTGSFTLTSEQLALDGIHYTLWVKEKTAEIVGFDVTDGFTGQVSIPSTVTNLLFRLNHDTV